MEQSKVQRLIDLFNRDESLFDRIEKAAVEGGKLDAARGELQTIAAEHDIHLDDTELETIQEWVEEIGSSRELSDSELDQVVGGFFYDNVVSPALNKTKEILQGGSQNIHDSPGNQTLETSKNVYQST